MARGLPGQLQATGEQALSGQHPSVWASLAGDFPISIFKEHILLVCLSPCMGHISQRAY